MKKHLLATIVFALFACGLTTDVWGSSFNFTGDPFTDAKKIERLIQKKQLNPNEIEERFNYEYKDDLGHYIHDLAKMKKEWR